MALFFKKGLLLPSVITLAHLAANPHYGFFRDELYFIVCGRHPDWGYVDQPPVVPLLAALSQAAGTSLFLLRAIPALFAGATAYVMATLARDMGGGRFAATLGALAGSLSLVLLAFGSRLGPDTVQMLAWPWAILCIGRARSDPRWWLTAGFAIGFGAEAKYSALLAAASIAAGLVLTYPRVLLSRAPWIGALLTAALIAPNAAWQYAHGWPMLELLQNGQLGKNVVLSPLQFLAQQVLLYNPVLSLVWLAGFAWCLRVAAWRWLGIGFLVLLATMIVLHGKAYYPAPIYPALFAAGGVAIERWTARRAWLRPVAMATVVAAGLVLAPVVSPVLREPAMLAYDALLARAGFGVPQTEHHRQAALGQDYADMHGWQELADKVHATLGTLPPDLRAGTWVFAANYGEAGAIDVLAPNAHPTLSGHNQYWLWGPRGFDGASILDVNGDLEADRRLCREARIVATFSAPYVMPYEDDAPLILCTGLRPSVAALWPKLKHYD